MKIVKAIGFIVSYLILIVGILFWNLKSFHLLIAFLCDYTVLLIVYIYLSFIIDKTKVIQVISHSVNGIGLGIFQGIFVVLLAYLIEGKSTFEEHLSSLPLTMITISLPMLIFQFLKILNLKKDIHLRDQKMGELATSAIAFPLVLLIGFCVHEISDENKTATIVAIVFVRIILELWMVFIRKENNSSEKKLRT